MSSKHEKGMREPKFILLQTGSSASPEEGETLVQVGILTTEGFYRPLGSGKDGSFERAASDHLNCCFDDKNWPAYPEKGREKLAAMNKWLGGLEA